MVTVANDPAQMMGDMPEATADGLSVRELLATPSLAGTTVLAGHSGLDRVVRGVNVMEVPDILAWVKPHELLLTTAFPLTQSSGPAGARTEHTAPLLELIIALNGKRLAALAIKLGRYLDAVPQQVLDRADQLGFPILRLPDKVAFDEVLPDLYGQLLAQQNQVLAQADALHRAISAIVLGGGGLTEIAAEVSRLLDCLALITTPDGRVLADEGGQPHRSGIEGSQLYDASGRFMVERLRIGVQSVSCTPAAAIDSSAATLDPSGAAAMTSIVAGGLDHGRIVAYRRTGGLPPGTVQALERVAIVAALTITKELAVAAVEGKFRGDYLRDVLTGMIAVDEQVVEHCRSLGWQIDRPMVVVVAELDPVDAALAGFSQQAPVAHRSQHERFASAWQQVLRARDKTAPVVGFSQEVVALIPVRSGDPAALVAEIVAAVSGDRGGGRRSFCAGVSRVVQSPRSLADGYAQARKTVAVGRRVHGHGSVSHFDSLGVHRLLSLVPDTAELKSFAAEVLAELAADTADAADLRTTLQTLLDTNLNVAETARLLHFHYNTLRYRIGKLERIVGPFTSDPNLRLDVALALQVVQMRGI
ncbi:MAG: PucR family transcriptional regulator ligand-binding domain-containing protein [Actinomycetota bacterium]|nr:PucR family transcriptional regulator ligand-binding domain-containing protein [Actinomycetota bacterium]MDQ2958321.1 PucR family transcriptional regulator ligand-binding domain-containing protein [Actinomycetota bacterium]